MSFFKQPAHGTELNLNYLASKYAEIISRRAAHSINRDFGTTVFKWWPSHSPDLTPCDHWVGKQMVWLIQLKQIFKYFSSLFPALFIHEGARVLRSKARH